jgi:ABC-type multidrug transport system fused ATPase/permease subunit
VKEHSGTPYRVTFARLLGFLRPYKVSLVVSTLLAIASQGAQIAVVWVTAHVIDDAVVVPLPHPSGASSWLNAPANRELTGRAAALVRDELARL